MRSVNDGNDDIWPRQTHTKAYTRKTYSHTHTHTHTARTHARERAHTHKYHKRQQATDAPQRHSYMFKYI